MPIDPGTYFGWWTFHSTDLLTHQANPHVHQQHIVWATTFQTICCWWTCGFAWWLWFPSKNHHWDLLTSCPSFQWYQQCLPVSLPLYCFAFSISISSILLSSVSFFRSFQCCFTLFYVLFLQCGWSTSLIPVGIPGAPEGILHWYGKMKGGFRGPPPKNFEI